MTTDTLTVDGVTFTRGSGGLYADSPLADVCVRQRPGGRGIAPAIVVRYGPPTEHGHMIDSRSAGPYPDENAALTDAAALIHVLTAAASLPTARA